MRTKKQASPSSLLLPSRAQGLTRYIRPVGLQKKGEKKGDIRGFYTKPKLCFLNQYPTTYHQNPVHMHIVIK